MMLNPFAGIGNFAQATKQYEVREFIGFDIDRRYINLTKKALDT